MSPLIIGMPDGGHRIVRGAATAPDSGDRRRTRPNEPSCLGTRIWEEPEPLPSGLGRIGAEGLSEPLAEVQLLLLFDLFQARGPDRAMAAESVPR
jgi:hypothetical protein